MTKNWTAPRDWADGELIDDGIMNTYVRDNLEALKEPPSSHYDVDEVGDYSTTQTTFVDVDSSNLSLTITTFGGPVRVWFDGTILNAGGITYLDVDVDGSRQWGDDGLAEIPAGTAHVSFFRRITGLSAGVHTFTLQWKVSAGTATLYSGPTASHQTHPQFGVEEQ